MSFDYDEEYTLGQDVTAIASSKGPKSIVVSVRLPVDEFARLEKLCSASGKSLSQVVRDAVAAHHETETKHTRKVTITMVSSGGNVFTYGAPMERTVSPCRPVFKGIQATNQGSARLGIALQA